MDVLTLFFPCFFSSSHVWSLFYTVSSYYLKDKLPYGINVLFFIYHLVEIKLDQEYRITDACFDSELKICIWKPLLTIGFSPVHEHPWCHEGIVRGSFIVKVEWRSVMLGKELSPWSKCGPSCPTDTKANWAQPLSALLYENSEPFSPCQ